MLQLRVMVGVSGAIWLVAFLWYAVKMWPEANSSDFVVLALVLSAGSCALGVLSSALNRYLKDRFWALLLFVIAAPWVWILGAAFTFKLLVDYSIKNGPPLIETSYAYILSRNYGVEVGWLVGTLVFFCIWLVARINKKKSALVANRA